MSIVEYDIGVTLYTWRIAHYAAGPNEVQVAAFRAKLSEPTALKSHFSYHYSASLITDGLANGTNPVYVYTMPRYALRPSTVKDLAQCLCALGIMLVQIASSR